MDGDNRMSHFLDKIYVYVYYPCIIVICNSLFSEVTKFRSVVILPLRTLIFNVYPEKLRYLCHQYQREQVELVCRRVGGYCKPPKVTMASWILWLVQSW